MTSFLCMGDLHLGAGSTLGAPGERLTEQAEILDSILALAVEREVDGILNGGDTFEGPGILPEQLEVFARFVERCNNARIPILATVGNGRHDAAVRTTNGMQIFKHIPGITVHAQPSIDEVHGVAVATLPWVPPGRLIASRNGGDRDAINREAAELLVDIARGLRAQISAEQLSVLMLHWSVSGAQTPTGALTDLFREPVLDVADLEALGFDAIVAAHIHKPQRLDLDGRPFFYTGSPMPLNFGEAGCDHGVWILDLDAVDTTAEFVPLESRKFVTLEADLTREGTSGLAYLDVGTMWNEMAEGGAFVKVKYRATEDQARRVDDDQLRQGLLSSGAHKVWIQPDVVRENRVRAEGLDEQVDDLDALELWIAANYADTDTATLARIRERHARYLEEIAA